MSDDMDSNGSDNGVDRRSVLKGVATAGVGLSSLTGLPTRSAAERTGEYHGHETYRIEGTGDTIRGTIRPTQAAYNAGNGRACEVVKDHLIMNFNMQTTNPIEISIPSRDTYRPDLDHENVKLGDNNGGAFGDFNDWVDKYPQFRKSRFDFNLCITNYNPNQVHNFISGGAWQGKKLCIVEGASKIANIQYGNPYVRGNGPDHKALNVALMEIGHNLKMNHDNGNAFWDGDRLVATPQITTYLNDHWENSCGKHIPSSNYFTKNSWRHVFSDCAVRESYLNYDWSG